MTNSSARTSLSYDDYQCVALVVEDLEHLEHNWTNGVSKSQLRRDSVVLRRLLVDGDYGRAWRLAGLPRSPIVRASDLEKAIGDVDRRYIAYAFAASPEGVGMDAEHRVTLQNPANGQSGDLLVAIPPTAMNFTMMARIPVAATAFITNTDGFIHQNIGEKITPFAFSTFWLDGFLSSAGGLVDEEVITRREIINYVANRLGGAHYGDADKPRAQAVQALLDKGNILIGNRLAAHVELLNIARTIVDSTDAFRLRHQFTKMPVPAGTLTHADDTDQWKGVLD